MKRGEAMKPEWKAKLIASRMGACERNPGIVIEMADRGCSLSEIGRAVGTTKRSVKRFLVRNGKNRKFPTHKMMQAHYNWKGGRLIDKDGYVLVHCANHPCRRKHTPYVLEHRLVMENHLGRFLLKSEVVHHINGSKTDNRIENLQLFSANNLHLRHELSGRVPKWTPEGKARILQSVHRTGDLRRGKTRAEWTKPSGLQSPKTSTRQRS